MSDKITLFEYETTASRADAAAWLRELADRLAADATMHFRFDSEEHIIGVADPIDIEVEVTHEDDRTKLEVEFHWTGGAPALEAASHSAIETERST